ncbi:hypothetical protein C8N35_10747 [Breoghania corrubedonensis]|uniref:Uncharacterized protein n=1 Tax=Breoghania corrubedonensis TaxID=665038 RepID=A0A2T5V6F7_9HYPH|nr:hypothetical protein [Breoghania corrubedonensis]PTW59334.1 hypothetical protein C8N35_10747 [Breoghania corrubedonensis]
MKLEEFEDRLDQFGPEIGAWPQDAAGAAETLLAESADARQLLDEARGLDRLFAATPAIKAPAGLADRIVTRAMSETSTPSGTEPALVSASGGSAARLSPEMGARAARIAAMARPVPATAIPPRQSAQAATRWYRELALLVFGSGNLARPALALAICFAAGLGAGYIFNPQSTDSSSYNVMASLFTYLDRT